MIRVPQVRVVDEEGTQRGVLPTHEALRLAQERGLDLVEVAPMASPPVVRFLDFGQYKYELTKREKEAKRKQRSVTFKEVRLKPKIGIGDFDTKVRRAIEFLEEGDRIKVAVQFRGRELTHPEIGRNLLTRFTEQIKDHGVLERAPLLEGKSMHITVASIHKPKSHDGTAATGDGPTPATDGSAASTSAPLIEPAPLPAPAAVRVPTAPAPAATKVVETGPDEAPAPVTARVATPAAEIAAPARPTAARATTTKATKTAKAAAPAATRTAAAAPAAKAPARAASTRAKAASTTTEPTTEPATRPATATRAAGTVRRRTEQPTESA